MAATERGRSPAVSNFIALLVLFGVLAGVHEVIAANPGATRSVAQSAVFQWRVLEILGGLTFVSFLFLNLTHLPGVFDPRFGLKRLILWPLLSGLLIGAVMVTGDLATGWSHTVAERMHLSSIHIAYPLSLPIYFGGAILVTIGYFFVLLPFLYWLFAEVIFKGRGEGIIYWVIAIPLALIEPVTQGDFTDIAKSGWPAAPNAGADLLLNFAQVLYLRSSGLVAAVLVRIGCYAVWHVIYPLL